MAGPAANFASVMVLGREMGKRTTAIYVSTVVVTAIAIGLAIDYLMPSEWFGIDPRNILRSVIMSLAGSLWPVPAFW